MDGDLKERRPAAGGHVVVIGGGIAGLAAAHRLRALAPRARVTLVEAEPRLGGKIATARRDGFVIEEGPDSFLASKPAGVALCEELGLGDRLQGVTPRRQRAFVLHRGRLHPLPEGLSGLVPTRLLPLARSGLLSPAGKARVALDYVLPPRRDEGDETLAAFIRRRLGREAWERLVEPLMAGIYAGDGDQLSLAATFPQLRDAERQHGGLIRGVLAARAAAPPAARAVGSAFLTPAAGMDEIVRALERRLRDREVVLCTGVAAAAVAPAASGFAVRLADDRLIPADAVIAATPAFVTAELIAACDAPLAADLTGIPYVSTAIVTLAYRHDAVADPLDGHGYIVPRAEGGPILACTWSSRKWERRAPAGWHLLRVFLGRSGAEEILAADDAALIALARQEVATRLGTAAPPAWSQVSRWPRGMPQYLLGHKDRLRRIERSLHAQPGLYLAGAAYYGVGIPDCIASGERAAAMAIRHLPRHDQ